MSTDSELRDSIERTKQAFRSGQDAPVRLADLANPEEPPRAAGREETPARTSIGLHPFFVGLLEALPAPGTDWPQSAREQWLETARNIFGLLFTDSEQRDPRPASHEPLSSQFERKVA